MQIIFSTTARLATQYEKTNSTRKAHNSGYHFYRVYGEVLRNIAGLIDETAQQDTESGAIEALRTAIDQRVEWAEPLTDDYLDAVGKGEGVYDAWFASAVNAECLEALKKVYKSLTA